jgi:hypothetical protein
MKMNYLKSKSFEAVNDFVHNPDIEFEELQSACLDIATELEKYSIKKRDLDVAVNKYCQCGGSGPGDNPCPACAVYHELTTNTA